MFKPFRTSLMTLKLVYAINMNSIHAFDEGNLYLTRGKEQVRLPLSSAYRKDILSLLPRLKLD